MWSRNINCRYGNGNCNLTNKRTTVPHKSNLKESYCLECVFLWLERHWKGAKKLKKPEMVISTRSGRDHMSVSLCINRVTYGIRRCLLNNDYQQSNAFFSAQCFAGGTRIPGCTFPTEQYILLLKVPLQSPQTELSMGVKVKKCKLQWMVPFLMHGYPRWSQGLYHSRGHKTRSYMLHIDRTAMLAIYVVLSTNDGILVFVHRFAFYAHAHYS